MPTAEGIVLFVHILGASIWLGGSISLGIVAVAISTVVRGNRELYSRVMSRVARSLGWLMWSALIVTVVTGLYNLSWYLQQPTLSKALAEPWLSAKLLMVGALLLLSAAHSFLTGPMIRKRMERGRMGTPLARLKVMDRAISILSIVFTLAIIFAAVMLAAG